MKKGDWRKTETMRVTKSEKEFLQWFRDLPLANYMSYVTVSEIKVEPYIHKEIEGFKGDLSSGRLIDYYEVYMKFKSLIQTKVY